MVRVGLIGCGSIGRWHTNSLVKLPDAQLVWAADPDTAAAHRFAGEFDIPTGADWRKLVRTIPTEAVFVCTPPSIRTRIAVEAARAGLHLFLEKPLALKLRDADRIVEAIAASGVKSQMGFTLRFWPGYRRLRELFTRGELGELVSLWTRRFMPFDPRGSFFAERAKSGGMTVDYQTHDFDWARWVGGEIASVYSQMHQVQPGMDVEDNSWTMLTFERGGCGVIGGSWSAALSDVSLGIVGTRGTAMLERDGSIRLRREGDEEEASVTLDPLPETIEGHFVRSIEEDRTPEGSALDGRAALELTLAAGRSARTGRVVRLRCGG